MKITEIISEMQQGHVYYGGPSTIDRSSPWVKKNMQTAADRTMHFKSLDNVKDQFEYIYKLKSASSKPQVYTKDNSGKLHPLVIKGYDNGIVLLSNSTNGLVTYRTDVNTLNFLGREKSITSPGTKYKFLATTISKEVRQPLDNKQAIKKQSAQNHAQAVAKAAREKEDERDRQEAPLVAARRKELDIDYKGIDDYYDDDDSFGSW
jgi:hypothetical protein